jgi:hypothetical protein
MKKMILWLVPFLLIAYIISGCSPKTKYERRLKHELASRVRYDSLFMGLYLGMPDKDFYSQCWKLNRKGLIQQGITNTTVEYQVRKELKYPAIMNFYPTFIKGKISEMPVRYVYSGWAPWNKRLSSDSLQVDILNLYKKQYGEDFFEVMHPEKGTAYIKIDGNRRISIFKEDELHVWAVFTDMSVTKEISDSISTIKMPIDTIKDLK